MFQDPTLWLAISFLIFLGFFIKLILPKIIAALQYRSDEIAKKFNELADLKTQAEQSLFESKLICDNLDEEANNIINNAHNEAKKIISQAKFRIEKDINYKIKLAEQKINQEKDRVIKNVKMSIISLAIEEIKKDFEKDKQKNKKLGEDAILHISKAIN